MWSGETSARKTNSDTKTKSNILKDFDESHFVLQLGSYQKSLEAVDPHFFTFITAILKLLLNRASVFLVHEFVFLVLEFKIFNIKKYISLSVLKEESE